MASRMDKYKDDKVITSRGDYHKDKYEHTMHEIKDDNYNLSDNVVYINNEAQLNQVVTDRNAFHKLKKMNESEGKIVEKTEPPKQEVEIENTIYDINLFLDAAGYNKEKYVKNVESKNIIDDTIDLYKTNSIFTKQVTGIKEIEELENTKTGDLKTIISNIEENNLVEKTNNIESQTNKLNKTIINTQVLNPIELKTQLIKNDEQETPIKEEVVPATEEAVPAKEELTKDDGITFDLLMDLKASESHDAIPPQKSKEETIEMNTINIKALAEKTLREKTKTIEKTNRIQEEKISDLEKEEADNFYDGTLSFDKSDFDKKNIKNKKTFNIIASILILLIIISVIVFVVLDVLG